MHKVLQKVEEIIVKDLYLNTYRKIKIQSDLYSNIQDIKNNDEKGYCLFLDLTADKTSAQPPIAMFTLKGGDMISNKYVGVGGLDGLSSGVVSSPVAGSKRILWGYSGVAVFNPYRSAVLREI